MKTISFTTEINAPIHKVWEALWNNDNYREWTKFFYPGSFYESDWEIGGRTLFLGPDRSGLAATITKLNRPREVIFNHLMEIKNGKEGESFAEGSFEKYKLSENNGVTTLVVSVDMTDEFEQDMQEGFTKGLEEVKRIAEADHSENSG